MAAARFESAVVAALGGVAGSLAAALLVRCGVRPRTAAALLAATGSAAALVSRGQARVFAGGAAAAGAGQLALAWIHDDRPRRVEQSAPAVAVEEDVSATASERPTAAEEVERATLFWRRKLAEDDALADAPEGEDNDSTAVPEGALTVGVVDDIPFDADGGDRQAGARP